MAFTVPGWSWKKRRDCLIIGVSMNNKLLLLETLPEKDYELLDSGEGEKLERYGQYIVARPDPQALWEKLLPRSEWQKADAVFSRASERAGWELRNGVPQKWQIGLHGIRFWVRPMPFKHVGVFPEQVPNWEWMRSVIAGAKRKVSVLNLFGYTGGATIAALQAGAEVCHVDGSKNAIAWARENTALSGTGDAPARWILDDARAFLKREKKRGRAYDGIVMDPPAFGHGPEGELWKIEDDFLELLALVKDVLADDPLFVLINGYASGYSALAYANDIAGMMQGKGGTIEQGELSIAESKSGRHLPCGIFARWKRA